MFPSSVCPHQGRAGFEETSGVVKTVPQVGARHLETNPFPMWLRMSPSKGKWAEAVLPGQLQTSTIHLGQVDGGLLASSMLSPGLALVAWWQEWLLYAWMLNK